MAISGALYGFGDAGDARQAAFAALARALSAIAALDSEARRHPLRSVWLRGERAAGLADAVRDSGVDVDPQRIIAAPLGAALLPRGHVQLGDLDGRAQRWAPLAQRRGPTELRALVARLAPARRVADLVALADQVSLAHGDCVRAAFDVEDDLLTGAPVLRILPAGRDAVDAADLALALPYALRRCGLTTVLLPGLVGRPRLLVQGGEPPLAGLTDWAATLTGQAGEGASRLRDLERYARTVERQLADVRRPAALRRLVAVALSSWSLWAAQLARATRVNISSAWRTLEQAADLGLVVAVPGQQRSRGDATRYAAPPYLRMAGLAPAPRGRAAAAAAEGDDGIALGAAVAELDAAMAAAERMT